MEHEHLSRYKRDSAIGPFQLTERDRDIIRQVSRHRFLRSPQIVALVGGSQQQVLRRLQRLFHHGYLERPYAQLTFFRTGGSHHMAYGLGNKGATLVNNEGLDIPYIRVGEQNHSIGEVFLDHALMVSDIMVELELACRKAGNVRLLWGKDLPVSNPPPPRPFRWKVNLPNGRKRGVVPDRVFALEFDSAGGAERIFYFLEADRGTTPVVRSDLSSQNSMIRKFLSYEATWAQSVHQTEFGFHRFRVLTVTTSEKRVETLVNACQQLASGHGLFLFAHLEGLKERILDKIWLTSRPGETSTLLS